MDAFALGGGSIATLMSWRDRIGRHALRWSGTPGFLAWWGRSLAAWLPPAWRRALGMDRGRVLLRAGDDVRDVPRTLADQPRWLLLPASSGLRRRLLLPAAATDRLRDVLAYEIDRQTPFAADAVSFDARVLQRRGDGQVEVELVAVPRVQLDAQLATLGAAAAELAGADLAGDDGEPIGVNLLPPALRRRRQDPALGWNLLLGAVFVAATAAMLAMVLHNRERAAERLQAQVGRQAVAARAVSMQRAELAGLVDGRAWLRRERASRPLAVAVLDQVAQRLPDDTWLDKLAIDNDRLLLIGRSAQASALVAKMEGAPQWRSPALTGTLQPDPRSGRDRFTLTADLAVTHATPATPATSANGGADAGRP
jgi:general secretion pathway protein L